jgi:uncharacterized membrane protein YozB (DUF420 family)
LSEIVPFLPHVNASLNALATVLLVAGFVLIKRETRAQVTMLTWHFGDFLACYLTYHFNTPAAASAFPAIRRSPFSMSTRACC